MKLICYGSSSRGNGYILQGERETLLLEAGLPLSNIRQFGVPFGQIQGCLISHRHCDHAKYIGDFLKAGIVCFANDDVWDSNSSLAESPYHGMIMPPTETTQIGEFKVVTMYANHDVPCWSYLIQHPEMGNLLFVTDSAGFNYSFDRIDHVMIECNWSDECLKKAVDEGRTNKYVAKRSRETHMGLEVMLDYLKSEDCFDYAKEVVLLHLSHENSDSQQFPLIVSESLSKPVYVAEYGLKLELTK